MYQVIRAKAKLSGSETHSECESMAAAHAGLRDNGWITTIFEADKHGKLTDIVSYWRVSKFNDVDLPNGFSYAYLPDRLYVQLTTT
ncbi:hypothetical protein CTM88_19230 [Photobacterium aquimaris]|jgi:hypothetical protein|uniref:Uncharacterized protein n=1 Tax=Photobacterium aquimaris TaxID=512643 RepID=A0A2T3IF33_9GAMM|nr:hypothetical protein [Photobacterium aquimaris]OBU22071.1 hypothetical protein AYY20_12835 [Photobacterium aquimaris]PSU24112.1 hypothetical protein CTM88_19230 [Photobacterium aquimaris]